MKKLILVLLATFLWVQPAFCGGLTTTFGEVLVENLPIGKSYSMQKKAKTPLVINNTSEQEVKLLIEVLLPYESELKEGFEPIPDIISFPTPLRNICAVPCTSILETTELIVP